MRIENFQSYINRIEGWQRNSRCGGRADRRAVEHAAAVGAKEPRHKVPSQLQRHAGLGIRQRLVNSRAAGGRGGVRAHGEGPRVAGEGDGGLGVLILDETAADRLKPLQQKAVLRGLQCFGDSRVALLARGLNL